MSQALNENAPVAFQCLLFLNHREIVSQRVNDAVLQQALLHVSPHALQERRQRGRRAQRAQLLRRRLDGRVLRAVVARW